MKTIMGLIMSIGFLGVVLISGYYQQTWVMVACDVGQGDAYLLQKGRFQVLIDTGPSLNKLLLCLEKNMPYLDKNIEVVLMTHADYDHYGGMVGLLDYYSVGVVYHNVYTSKEDIRYAYFIGYLEDYLNRGKLKYSKVGSGLTFRHKDGEVMFLSASDIKSLESTSLSEENQQSIVTIFSSLQSTILFTADTDSVILEAILRDNLITFKWFPATIMTVPHHGSKTGLNESLISLIKPKYCIISVGKNSHGHPNPEIVDLLSTHKCEIYTTSLNKSVKFSL